MEEYITNSEFEILLEDIQERVRRLDYDHDKSEDRRMSGYVNSDY